MTEQDTEQGSQQQPATQAKAASARVMGKRPPPRARFFIAGASLAQRFGLAARKRRGKGDNTDRERGLD